jgi:hypothetical protein
MKIIKEGILAFTRDDHIISFDTREEYDNASIADLNINHIFATPADMVRKYRKMEDTLEGIRAEDEHELEG